MLPQSCTCEIKLWLFSILFLCQLIQKRWDLLTDLFFVFVGISYEGSFSLSFSPYVSPLPYFLLLTSVSQEAGSFRLHPLRFLNVKGGIHLDP